MILCQEELGRVNCLSPEQGRNLNSQLSSAISASILPIESQNHYQPIHYPCEWFGHDHQVLLVKLEQLLHLKVDCSDFGPVRDRGSLPYVIVVIGQELHPLGTKVLIVLSQSESVICQSSRSDI